MQQVSYAAYLKNQRERPILRKLGIPMAWLKELDGRLVTNGKVFHFGCWVPIPECWCIEKAPLPLARH